MPRDQEEIEYRLEQANIQREIQRKKALGLTPKVLNDGSVTSVEEEAHYQKVVTARATGATVPIFRAPLDIVAQPASVAARFVPLAPPVPPVAPITATM